MGDRSSFERGRAGPWALVELPDGQGLQVIVTARTRTPDGMWWYELQAVLYGRAIYASGQTRAEAAPIEFTAPADAVQPLEGQDYTAVPTTDMTIARPWRLQILQPEPAVGPAALLHRGDCWQGRHGRPLSDDEARAAAADPDVGPCQICHPERAARW